MTNFKPWIGELYGNSPFRLMILGESHHAGSDAEKHGENFTQEIVRENAFEKGHRFFTALTNTFLGSDHGPEARVAFWNSVVFYNFVPGISVPKARMAPSRRDFDGGKAPFENVLASFGPDQLPDVIFICGVRLMVNFDRLVAKMWEETFYDSPGGRRYTFTFDRENPATKAYYAYHPSGSYELAFQREDWAGFLRKADLTDRFEKFVRVCRGERQSAPAGNGLKDT